MCPACLASVALIITGIMSTGGLTALAARKLHAKHKPGGSFDSQDDRDLNIKSEIHGKERR